MCLLGIVERPGVSSVWCLGVSWGNKTDPLSHSYLKIDPHFMVFHLAVLMSAENCYGFLQTRTKQVRCKSGLRYTTSFENVHANTHIGENK